MLCAQRICSSLVLTLLLVLVFCLYNLHEHTHDMLNKLMTLHRHLQISEVILTITELQIREGIDDDSKMIFLTAQCKHML